MTVITINQARHWLKHSPHPRARLGLATLRRVRQFELPAPALLYQPLYIVHRSLGSLLGGALRVFYWTPLFKSRVARAGKRLYLFGGLPYLSGPLDIRYGDDCRISGRTTISGRSASQTTPRLLLGNNIDIGWMTTIAVGREVRIGNNVRIAGRAFLAGYPGHPIDAADRAAGLPDRDEQVGDIHIDDDAWLATGVSVMPGVRIGKRSIIAAGSVVTHDIPDDVLAAGAPARVVRSLIREDG